MNKLSIGAKIAISFAIVLILLLVIGFLTLNQMARIKKDNDWITHTQSVLRVINREFSDLQDAEIGQRGFIMTGLESYLEPYNNALIDIPKELATLKQLTSDNVNQQQRLTKLEGLISEKSKELNETITLRKTEGFDAAIKVVNTNVGKVKMDEIRTIINDMINEESKLYDQRSILTKNSEITAKTLVITITLIAFLIVVFLIVYLTRIIAFPIQKISAIADRISSGDLSCEIEIDRKDEIGILADSFKQMQKALLEKAEIAKEISKGNLMVDVQPLSDKDTMGLALQTMVANLRSQLKDISEGINVLAASSSEIMAAVTQLASSSTETATSVGETTTTVEEVKQTSEVSSHKANEVSVNAKRMSDISKEGATAIANTIEGMNRIKQQMSAIASMVVRLSEQSQTIGEITTSVNEIAEQSNLLAVNAAIEAAKAGEQGKGFTVVAQEIKMLADRSKEATAQVRNILRDVQKSISSAVMATEEGGKAVEEGLKLTSLSGATIRTLSESVAEAANAAILIAASSQQQLEGMDQVVAAMENIKEASSQSVTSTQQSVDSVKELQKVGQKLNDMIRLYKLEK